MSIYSDYKCGALSYDEFKTLAIRECKEHYPNLPEERVWYCHECEFCKPAKKYMQEIVTRISDGKQVLKNTDKYGCMDVCVKDVDDIREIHAWDEVCNDHGELCERVDTND